MDVLLVLSLWILGVWVVGREGITGRAFFEIGMQSLDGIWVWARDARGRGRVVSSHNVLLQVVFREAVSADGDVSSR
jgi:hypothetical protein